MMRVWPYWKGLELVAYGSELGWLGLREASEQALAVEMGDWRGGTSMGRSSSGRGDAGWRRHG